MIPADTADGRRDIAEAASLPAVRNITRGHLLGDEVAEATTFVSRMRGLLGRRGLSPGQGLWLRPCRSIHSFGMRFEFDALFLDGALRVVALCERVGRNRVAGPFAGAASVLELPAGVVAGSGTAVGDVLAFGGDVPGGDAAWLRRGGMCYKCFECGAGPARPMLRTGLRQER